MVAGFVCVTCGVGFTPAPAPPPRCPVCEDERQYVGRNGQEWTTLEGLRVSHAAEIRECEPELTGIGMHPAFAIGQRALLVETGDGNVLWDCVPLLDEVIAGAIERRGGLRAIAISHPHYYATMVDWSREFDAPIHLHHADREWIMRPDPRIRLWDGDECALAGGLTLIRLGGHFAGGTVLHWAGGAGGRGALLCGDIVQVVEDRRFVSFMRSYPNLIPLPARVVAEIAARLDGFDFDRIYGAWFDAVVQRDGKAAVRRSAERYIRALDPVAFTP